jgi:hypothetical protein
MNSNYRYHHTGIPCPGILPEMRHIPHLKIYATDHEANPFNLQWMYYEEGCGYPRIIMDKPHVAFVVDNLYNEIIGKLILIPPNSPSQGVLVAMIEEKGSPIELMQISQ